MVLVHGAGILDMQGARTRAMLKRCMSERSAFPSCDAISSTIHPDTCALPLRNACVSTVCSTRESSPCRSQALEPCCSQAWSPMPASLYLSPIKALEQERL